MNIKRKPPAKPNKRADDPDSIFTQDQLDGQGIGEPNVVLTEQFLDYSNDEWDEGGQEEVLYESEEFSEQDESEPIKAESIISDDLPVLPLRGVVVYPMMWLPLADWARTQHPLGRKHCSQ